MPDELRRRQTRLAKLKEAKAALEAEAQEKANTQRQAIQQREQVREQEGKPRSGRKAKAPSATPYPKAQRNFTDPQSRIMKDGASKSFEQAYNCQAASDEKAQVIVGTQVTQQPNDKQQLKPLIQDVKNKTGQIPQKASADSGYYSEPRSCIIPTLELSIVVF